MREVVEVGKVLCFHKKPTRPIPRPKRQVYMRYSQVLFSPADRGVDVAEHGLDPVEEMS